MLLCDPCFMKAEAVRIHMYVNLIVYHNLTFLIVSDYTKDNEPCQTDIVYSQDYRIAAMYKDI